MKVSAPKPGIIDFANSLLYTYWTHARFIWSMALAWPFFRYDLVWGPDHLILVFLTGFTVYIIGRFIFLLPFFSNTIDRGRAEHMFTIEVDDEEDAPPGTNTNTDGYDV